MTNSSILVEVVDHGAIVSPLNGNAQPLVSVVLLSYNRPALLEESLASVLHQSYNNIEVTVVDNPSAASREIERIVRKHPLVKLIQNDLNLGYAGGMNKGVASVCGDYVYLTEDDVVLETGCIERFVNFLEQNAGADLLAPIIYNKTAGTIRCAGGDFVLGGVYRRKIHGAGEHDTGQFPEAFSVNYIDGAGMFARRDFWQQFKGFREEYFMYVDAVELCVRVAKAGKSMTVVPQAKVFHFEPTPEPIPADLEFHKLKNFFSLYLLHAPARVLPEFIFRYAVINGLRSLFRKSAPSPQVFLKALMWVARRTPSLLKERFAQRD
jgi:GT2 family glycosyltransferase